MKNTVAKGTTDDEFLYFMTICRKHRIDPFTKQIYCVVWPTNEGKSHDLVIIMGIGGYRMTAARDHKDFGGTSAAVFTWPEKTIKTPAGRTIPDSATVKAIRKGGEVSEATVYWEEFAPRDLSAKRSDFWNRMPKHMLAKCAEAHAIRKAFPDLSDIFTEEEISQKLQDITPGGRQIVDEKGFSPSGQPVTFAAQTNAQITEEVERQKQEHSGNRPKSFAGSITIDYTADESNPKVLCSSEQVLILVQAACTLVWGKDEFWHLQNGRDLGNIRKVCDKNTIEYIEIVPTKPVPPSSSGSSQRRPENKSAAKSGKKERDVSERVSSPISSRARLISESYIKSTELKTTPNTKVPYLVMLVKTNNRAVWMSTFDHNFFDWFVKAREHGVDCDLYIEDNEKHGPNVVGIKRIGNVEFDGKKPVPKKTTEAPTGSLFQNNA